MVIVQNQKYICFQYFFFFFWSHLSDCGLAFCAAETLDLYSLGIFLKFAVQTNVPILPPYLCSVSFRYKFTEVLNIYHRPHIYLGANLYMNNEEEE